MAKARDSVLPQTIEKARSEVKKRLAKRWDDETFREDLKRIKASISVGSSLTEARINLGFQENSRWNDLVLALSVSVFSPETIMLEWQIRNQTRYNQAMNLYISAKNKVVGKGKNQQTGDMQMMAKAIMLLNQIDSNDIELKRAMGLVKPIKFDDGINVGEGISDEDLRLAGERFERTVNERILYKLEIRKGAKPPVPLNVLTGAKPGGDTDTVGTVTLDAEHSGGSKP